MTFLRPPRLTVPVVLSLSLAVLSCTEFGVGPEGQGSLELFQSGDFSDASGHLNNGVASVRVVLDDERLLARRVRIGTPEKNEEIEGPVTKFELTSSGGAVTIAPGFVVHFTGETEFEIGDEDVTKDVFIARLTAALAEGAGPWVEAERDAPDEPQAPDNASFVAEELSLHRPGEHLEFRLNVDRDNLVRNASPPPDGWLKVLGLTIELRVSEGLTVIEIENDEVAKREFAGAVEAVDLAARSLLLEDGLTIRVVEDTELHLRTDHGFPLRSLEAAAQAIDAGLAVFAAGIGAVETEDPPVLVAIRLALVVRAELTEFKGRVTAVDVEAGSFTLEDGTVVRLFAGTVVLHESRDFHRFGSLEAVAEALAQGRVVIAQGVGAPLPGVENTLLALKVAFAPPLEKFKGVVASVDLEAKSVTLDDGTVVRVPEGSIHHELGDHEVLTSLEAVVEAMEAGKEVLAAGVGLVESRDPLTLTAVRVVFFVAPPPLQRFHGVVASVDLDAHTVTLENGTLIRVPDDAIHHESGDALRTLADVAAAMEAGKTVVATGVGEVESEDPLVLVAVKVVFVVQPPGLVGFEGVVTGVNTEAGTVTLKDGTVIRITDKTKIHDESGDLLGSLDDVAQALEKGHTVVAAGFGVLESEDPRVIVAQEIAFFVRPPVLVFFTGTVASVDLESRQVKLKDGTVVQLTDRTQIAADEHTLPSLEAVAEAIAAGRAVVAAGVGEPVAADPKTYVAVKIVFVASGG
jgi:predicted RNA-binding protein